MRAPILHHGFDGLKFTVQADIPQEFRTVLWEAKQSAIKHNEEVIRQFGDIFLSIRRSGGAAFSAHTGNYGAEWYFLDPENKPKNNPGVTVDFRAFLLAAGGLDEAEQHFRECMAAFGIPYDEHLLRVSRVDYAIDFLAPWFEPSRDALVTPPKTKGKELTGSDETETHVSGTRVTGTRVTGLRIGAVANRQLVIYDKRQEVLQTRKFGWVFIWAEELEKLGLPLLELNDPSQSRIWRFELRMGSKQLRNRWEMHSWQDLRDIVGDAYSDFCEHMRYTSPNDDTNRSRWPSHPLWRQVVETIGIDLAQHRSGVLPSGIKEANRTEHMRMLDGMILGLMVSRAAASEVQPNEFDSFMETHLDAIKRLSDEHPVPVQQRLAKAADRYRFR